MAKVSSEQEVRKSSITIIKCSCKHKYQDEKYGIGNRVGNNRNSDKHKDEARCTVCGNIKSTK